MTGKQSAANGLAAFGACDDDRSAALAQRFVEKTGDITAEPSVVTAVELNEVLMPRLLRVDGHVDHRTFLCPSSQIRTTRP